MQVHSTHNLTLILIDMVFVSSKKSREGARSEAQRNGMQVAHIYNIKNYVGYGNFLVASPSELDDAMNMYRCFGLRWFLYRGLVVNVCAKGEDAVREYNEKYNDNI